MSESGLSGLNQNWVSRASAPVNDYDWSIKIDHQIWARQKLAYSMWIQADTITMQRRSAGPVG